MTAEVSAQAVGVPDWEVFVRQHFPAYLLPVAHRQAISRADAEQFLSHFGDNTLDLELVCAASLFSDPAKLRALTELAERLLPSLAAQLPATTEVERREWEGGFRGRLDLPATLALHRAGKPTRYVTRDRRRRYDLPETLLARAVVTRILELLKRLRRAGIVAVQGWGSPLLDAEVRLEAVLLKSSLRDIPVTAVEPSQVMAARRARHPAYGSCARWQDWLREALDQDDTRADHLARGALFAMTPDKRFQVAVLLRLVMALREELDGREPGKWDLEYGAISAHRQNVAALKRGDGASVLFHYDKPVLKSGLRDSLVEHHLGSDGKARPDVTILFCDRMGRSRAVVVEVKQSIKRDYLVKGIEEAIVYRHEYEGLLVEWPKAMVVAEGGFVGQPRREDEVIALNWQDLLPQAIATALLSSLAAQESELLIAS